MKVHRKQILDLAKYDPIVGTVLQYWHGGDLTWEEAMMICVSELAKQNATLRKNYEKDLLSRPAPALLLPEVEVARCEHGRTECHECGL